MWEFIPGCSMGWRGVVEGGGGSQRIEGAGSVSMWRERARKIKS